MCREVVIFDAEYFKYPHSHGLQTSISELERQLLNINLESLRITLLILKMFPSQNHDHFEKVIAKNALFNSATNVHNFTE